MKHDYNSLETRLMIARRVLEETGQEVSAADWKLISQQVEAGMGLPFTHETIANVLNAARDGYGVNLPVVESDEKKRFKAASETITDANTGERAKEARRGFWFGRSGSREGD